MLRPQLNNKRNCISLNGIWDFKLENDQENKIPLDFTEYKKVAVPSSFNDLFTDDKVRNHIGGIWYLKKINIPEIMKGKKIFLHFEAVNYRAKVFLNDIEIGSHETGYTPFEFDITDKVYFDKENVLKVRVDQLLSMNTIPQGKLKSKDKTWIFNTQYPDVNFDFFPYSGIHRSVFFYSTDELYLKSLKINTDIEGSSGIVEVNGNTSVKAGKVELTIKNHKVTATITGNNFSEKIVVPNANLWNVGEPNLYNLKINIFDSNQNFVDEYTQKVGIRKIEVKNNKFLINGKAVYFKGFGKHEDFHIIGKGNCDAVNIRDFEIMKWVNANSFRTSHYPYSEDILDLADEYGFLVISETAAVSLNFAHTTEGTLKTHLQQLEELISRDYNHPSVVMWSIANEPRSDMENSYDYFKPLVEKSKSLDKTRPVTMASCFVPNDKAVMLFDICCVNRYPGWYLLPGQIDKSLKDLSKFLDDTYEKFKLPIMVSEFGADAISGIHSLPHEMWSEEYQKDIIMEQIDIIRSKNFIIGEHIWNLADFRTSQNHIRANGNKKGIFTRERQPKLVAHFLKERWK